MNKEALKLALEALIGARAFLESDAPVEIWGVNDKAITAINEALAQPEQEPVTKKWILHGSFADVASFDAEGVPSFYWKESVAKFNSGQLSTPCKGKNCGSLNGWLHSAECHAEHEAQYTTQPQPKEPEPEQEPNSVTYKEVADAMNALYMGDSKQVQIAMEMETKRLYTTPPQPKEPEQEPVGTLSVFDDAESDLGWSYDISANLEQHKKLRDMNGAKIYTTPPQRKPLTEEQIMDVAKSIDINFQDEGLAQQIDDILTFARAIEAAHGIKE